MELKRLGTLLDAGREATPAGEQTSSRDGTPTPQKVSGVPPRRVHDTFASFDLGRNPSLRDAVDRCVAVSRGDAWCALLAGPPGTGKTHLAVAAMNEYGMVRSYFWKVPEFLDWLRTMAYGSDAKWDIAALTQSYRTSEALIVFDDLGTENSTDWAQEQLYRVLDSRYEYELPTIITTNQDVKRLDARLLSRFAGGLVVCKGTDVRRSQ